jgi:hypothetical protein
LGVVDALIASFRSAAKAVDTEEAAWALLRPGNPSTRATDASAQASHMSSQRRSIRTMKGVSGFMRSLRGVTG